MAACAITARGISVALCHPNIHIRCLSCTSAALARWKKNEFRLKKHNNRVGDRSSDMVTIPDWSFSDGTPSPPGLYANKNMEIQKQICKRIIIFLDEMKKAEEVEKEAAEANT
ncbi:large ribosomal subunit protein mL52-like [Styela clava]|uniref:39S ribosomal protein L52, mitochondrial-like n=1 Tax=Styela clava TaxID=7725 RepID=UPI00193ABB11|nr:39S ribosomal protein L52, mitochondrial-like [Styela clava]